MRLSLVGPSILLAAMTLAVPAFAAPGILVSINIAPPALPVYEQPECPGDGYIWTPGYWAYSDDGGYFWVPGTWVLIPEPGFLWTPGYWGFENALFVFHEGYWGPTVGFYGGINYGFGYIGVGYEGGYWSGGAFFYNRSVNNVGHVTNVYEKTVAVNNVHVSYNGGAGGVTARPNAAEEAAMRDRHVPPVSAQTAHVQAASTNRQLFESANHGSPAIAAVARPGEFSGGGVVAARSAAPEYKAPAERGGSAPSRAPSPTHARDIPQPAHNPIPSSGNAEADRKFSERQQQLNAKQEKERQQLQQRQESEHQKIGSNAAPAKTQALEQKHQAQTNQLMQRHTQEQENLKRQAPSPAPGPKK
jgi:WXXGXW repeat (2 copies)